MHRARLHDKAGLLPCDGEAKHTGVVEEAEILKTNAKNAAGAQHEQKTEKNTCPRANSVSRLTKQSLADGTKSKQWRDDATVKCSNVVARMHGVGNVNAAALSVTP